MDITPEEKEWADSIVFSKSATALKESIEDYAQYVPPLEKKLSEKVAAINYLKLQDRSNLKILDIGTGCGHFPQLCNSLGHSATGTEIPESILTLNSLHQIYNLEVFELTIERQKYFKLPQKYNLITLFRTVFDHNWDFEDWKFLKENLSDFLEPGGEIFLKTNIKAIPNIETCIEPTFGTRLPGWNSLTFHYKL